jgi:selenocysteine lyase/cysteine desulfurase
VATIELQNEQTAYGDFLRSHTEYSATIPLDELRATEYSRLDRDQQVYLDYTGAGLYGESQVREYASRLSQLVLGNPHSANLSSSTTTALVERTRHRVLDFFNAPQDDYTAIFTLNATGALKHVGECYPFDPRGRLLLTFDNHNSVNGIREFARGRGTAVEYVPMTNPDLRIDRDALGSSLAKGSRTAPCLFAFPAQSNFSGVQHPLELVAEAHAQGWDVLLDAAAFVPTNRLDIAALRPEFVCVSFYKIFGFPTGVGCLLARRETLERLRRPWFAGGTVNFASVQGQAHVLSGGEAGFEDGTLNFLSIPAIDFGLAHLERVGLDLVHARVQALTDWLLRALVELRHENGRHMVRVYGPTAMSHRGGTVAFNLYDPDGHLLDYRRIDELASAERISIRSGCFCNPGAGEAAEGLTEEDMQAGLADANISLPRFLQIIHHRGGKSAGALRVSLGIASNFSDVYRFAQFVAGFRDKTQFAVGEVSFDIDSCRIIRDGT